MSAADDQHPLGAAAAAVDGGGGSGAASTASELLSHADAIIGVSDLASAATLAAVQGSVWTGTRWFINLLMWSHDSLGLPWFEAIAATNLLARVATIPITYQSQKLQPQMKSLRQDTMHIAELSKRVKKARTSSEYMALSNELTQAHEALDQRWPRRTRLMAFVVPFFSIAQAVVFFSQFRAVLMLTDAKLPSMTYEGALWFQDLTLPDPLYGLPVLCTITTLAMLQSRSFADSMAAAGPQSAFMKKAMTFVALAFIPMGGSVSSAVALLWAANSVFMMAQSALLGSGPVRAAIGLPPLPPPAAAADGSAGGSSGAPSLVSWLQGGSGDSGGKPQPASAAGAPPPGSKKAAAQPAVPKPGVAVSYTPFKPRKRRARVA